ncbi:hypothetical protein MMB17_18605 [Methylobacterium organophilum]|uniref:hypothetical protein n=1 Tax=Methylobacterium organophilum TaxID=410 RepID=UPI001F1294A9|nr:hypothetical protein [Methylobacterium organophilum]UMY16674.1 hypothetical protein MMB17_18605 [Methylobacterium organophilum]
MTALRILAFLGVLLAAGPALSQDRPLSPGTLKSDGTISFGSGLPNLGKRQAGKTILTPDALQIGGPGSTGEAADFSVTAPVTGAFAYGLGERSADEVNVMAFIPPGLRADIRAGTSTADLTQYVRNAFATCKDVRFPTGRYTITDRITFCNTQQLRGAGAAREVGRYGTTIRVPKTFNMSAGSVFKAADNAGIDGVLIDFDQSGVTTRAAVVQYPAALDLVDTDRFMIGHVRLQKCWFCVNAVNVNSRGTFSIRQLEMSPLNTGLAIDNNADYVQALVVHNWPWGMINSGNANDAQLLNIYQDGTPVALSLGRSDAANFRFFSSYRQRLIVGTNTETTWYFFGHLDMDGDGAVLDVVGSRRVEIDSLNSTKSAAGASTRCSVLVSHGRATITRINTVGGVASPDGDVCASGDGVLTVNGGKIQQRLADYPAASVSGGGKLWITGTTFDPDITQARTVGYVKQTGGILIATNNTATYRTTGSGNLIQISQDGPGNKIMGNDFGAWGYSVPFGSRSGLYGPNFVEPFTWTPTMTFTTPGDLAGTTYTNQKGFYWYEANGMRFSFNVSGNIGTYTTASGQFIVAGLPFGLSAGQIGNPVVLGPYSKMTFTSGYNFLTAIAADTFVYFRQSGSNNAASNITTANVPSGTTALNFTGSGFIPQR